MPTVFLGNPAALEYGNPVGEQVTVHIIPESDTHDERMRTLTHHREGVWFAISDDKPSWVASDDDSLAQAIAAHYDCSIIPIRDARGRFLDKHPHPALVAHVSSLAAGETKEEPTP